MKGKSSLANAILAIVFLIAISGCKEVTNIRPDTTSINGGWSVQSSLRAGASGGDISIAGFPDSSWCKAAVPSTVMAVLAENGKYPDPYFGINMLSTQTGLLSTSSWSAFSDWLDLIFGSWWFRTEFDISNEKAGSNMFLNIDGINYRANIWMNGKLVADKSEACGTYRRFSFDVTGIALPGKRNAVAIQVFRPGNNDLSLTWVDWAPTPPDRNMGLWHGVSLSTCGSVKMESIQVITDELYPDAAHLKVLALLKNLSHEDVRGNLTIDIEGIRISTGIHLNSLETKEIELSSDEFPGLVIRNPRLWLPVQMGEPNLYSLKSEFETGGSISDKREISFGIRKVTSELTPQGHRLFRINGRPVFIKAAAWASDLMLRYQPEREEAEIRYVRDMNLNAIRFEGNLGSDNFLGLCDKYGIMVIAGWCCCSRWENWENWDSEDYTVAAASLNDQIRRLRNHPSLIAWLNGSDFHPPADVESMYLDIIKKNNWPNPVIAGATEVPSEVSGPTGVKMTGPYEWVPPVYWYADTERGGAFGFNTETSPGPAVPEIESLMEMLPEDHLWPIDLYWDYHCGREKYWNLAVVTKALNERYGKSDSIEEYSLKAQASSYEAERAMFEAYRRNKYVSTGVVQWMLGNPWPSMIWHLYDYYLRPGGGYFGTKKACEPLHIQYSYDDRSVVVVNDLYEPYPSMTAAARIYDISGRLVDSREATLDIAPDSSTKAFNISEPSLKMYFLRLELKDQAGKTASENTYWLSSKPDVPDYKCTLLWYTPTKSYADFKGLNALAEVELKAAWDTAVIGDEIHATAGIENPSDSIAFMVRLKAVSEATGEEILPVLWEDNYLTLLPGETRTIKAVMNEKPLSTDDLLLEIQGWNVKPLKCPEIF